MPEMTHSRAKVASQRTVPDSIGRPLGSVDRMAHGVSLSILMPAYNEENTIAQAVNGVLRTPFACDFELIVIDDGSTDMTSRILDEIRHPNLVVVRHGRNHGKGAALKSGAFVATGTHLVPFDADLEYEPADLIAMAEPVMRGRCDVVYGTRMFGTNSRYQSYSHAMGNRMLTLTANVLFDAYISDMHTCLKLLPVELFRTLDLAESGFGLDTEITAKILKLGIRPFEVPVAYYSRSVAQGKKITWRDGVECLQVLGRVRVANERQPRARRNHARTQRPASPAVSRVRNDRHATEPYVVGTGGGATQGIAVGST